VARRGGVVPATAVCLNSPRRPRPPHHPRRQQGLLVQCVVVQQVAVLSCAGARSVWCWGLHAASRGMNAHSRVRHASPGREVGQGPALYAGLRLHLCVCVCVRARWRAAPGEPGNGGACSCGAATRPKQARRCCTICECRRRQRAHAAAPAHASTHKHQGGATRTRRKPMLAPNSTTLFTRGCSPRSATSWYTRKASTPTNVRCAWRVRACVRARACVCDAAACGCDSVVCDARAWPSVTSARPAGVRGERVAVSRRRLSQRVQGSPSTAATHAPPVPRHAHDTNTTQPHLYG
jgi:hypothetical protein